MDLWDDLRWRGLVYQWTGEDALPARLRSAPVTLYCGFDPTSDALHVGSLVPLTLLRRFQRAGHRPIAIVGGATGMIGDPSGRSEERTLLGAEELERNLAGIRATVERFLDVEGETGALVLNNADWLATFGFIEFLRDVGKHFSVNAMLGKESVRARLEGEAGLSYTEFSYMLLQAYDFVHLRQAYGCELQVGGSDQFGNITAGAELARRMLGTQLFGLTTPLVTRSDGQKMGKTAGGAVWLAPRKTSAYAFYQYFVRTPDADAGRFLRFFTELPREEIVELEEQVRQAPQQRRAQRRLARELTLLVHDEDGLRKAERATQALFGGELEGLTESDLLEIFADVPSSRLDRGTLSDGLPVVDAFVRAGLAGSRGEARRLIAAGGGYVNNRRVESDETVLGAGDLASETVMVLRAGKRSFSLLQFPR